MAETSHSKAEFDRYAAEYYASHVKNIAVSGEGPEYFAEYKVRETAGFVAGAGLAVRRLLDFGAGIGNSVPYFRRFFSEARLTLADPSREALDVVAKRFPGPERLAVIDDGGILPFADSSFDLCFSACVFHHIVHERHMHWLAELRRVTRPGGMIIVFEHNPLNPLTRHVVYTCPFDVNARLITAPALRRTMSKAGWQPVRVQFHIFFPAALAALRGLEPLLCWIPLGAQYSAWSLKQA